MAVLSQNNPEWCLTFWAAVSMGAILVGLNGWWKADEILYGLQDSGAEAAGRRRANGSSASRTGWARRRTSTQVLLIDAGPDDFPVAAASGVKLQRFDDLGVEPSDEFPDAPHRRRMTRR